MEVNNYRPTLQSISEQPKKMKNYYRPTLQAIAEIPEEKQKNDIPFPMPNYPFVNRPQSEKERQESNINAGSAFSKGIQNFANTPEEIANVFGGHLYNKFNFAPQNKAADIGGVLGDLASYFLPGGVGKIGIKGLSYIPKANEIIKSAQVGLKSRPIINFLTNLGKNTGEAALFQKTKNPESRPIDVVKAGGIGGSLSVLANAVANQNPFIRTASKLGLGGLLGYQANGYPGALEGAGAAMFLPKLLGEIGIGRKPISAEMLTQEPNLHALAKYKAGQNLGDVGTPAEVFNSPIMGARQGEIGRSEAGANAMTQFGENRIKLQHNAIKSLLNKIYPNTKSSNNKIKSLYKKSYQNNITQNSLSLLMEDPVISQASQKVYNDPAYAKELINVRPDNYAYLDQVKRAIDDMEQSALRTGEKNKARIYKDSKDNLVNIMDKEAPDYKLARDEAQRRIVRDQIVKRLNKKDISGKNFYREFLSNENKFNDLLHDVKKNPEATKMLKDMKISWDNLIGYDTPATAAGMTAKHTNTAREGFQKFWNEFKDIFGAPRDIERAKFISDPNWWSKFDEVIKYKNKLERNKKLSDLIARGISSGSLEYEKERVKGK
jgi:hypothetical protein